MRRTRDCAAHRRAQRIRQPQLTLPHASQMQGRKGQNHDRYGAPSRSAAAGGADDCCMGGMGDLGGMDDKEKQQLFAFLSNDPAC